jgi:hypothetical protein
VQGDASRYILASGPEGGRHQLLLPRRRDAPHPVDTRVHPLPLAGAEPVLDGLASEAGLQSLSASENAELSGCEPAERILSVC